MTRRNEHKDDEMLFHRVTSYVNTHTPSIHAQPLANKDPDMQAKEAPPIRINKTTEGYETSTTTANKKDNHVH